MKSLRYLLVLALIPIPSFGKTNVYGFITANWEKSERSQNPAGANDRVNPNRISNPYINVMIQNSEKDYRSFLNINGGGAGNLDVRNAWFEGQLAASYLKYRIGKLYRPFDIYNEILDAVPTYIGIEAPEMFDSDHPLISRTTNFMLYGNLLRGNSDLRYSLTTGNDQRAQEEVPVGGDLRWEFSPGSYTFLLGTSFYYSGRTGAGELKDDGPSDSAVSAWMARDNYTVNAFFTQLLVKDWVLQASYARSHHDAQRNASFISSANHRDHFSNLPLSRGTRFCQNADCTSASNVNLRANYIIETWYIRLGHSFEIKDGATLTPYLQYDYYSNAEMIGELTSGGDNEAGWSDDGKFRKSTVGIVYRPYTHIAIKLDSSQHYYTFNSKDKSYNELRSSFAYQWSL